MTPLKLHCTPNVMLPGEKAAKQGVTLVPRLEMFVTLRECYRSTVLKNSSAIQPLDGIAARDIPTYFRIFRPCKKLAVTAPAAMPYLRIWW